MQALLLDTHMVLWWVQGSPRINSQLRRTIESRLSYVSIVSLWEIAIKLSLGKVGLPIAMEDLLSTAGFTLLPLTLDHVAEVGLLPFHHRDPFDRMLIAQTRVEGLRLVTRDRDIERYDVLTL